MSDLVHEKFQEVQEDAIDAEPDEVMKPLDFIDLPEDVIEIILDYLSFDEVAQNRILCRRMNAICSQILNRAFTKTTVRHATLFKSIKSMLPRRESERRNHALARHADILTCVETRLSMLTMTYSKYIDLNMCCFIPGKVLDEIRKVLNLVSTPREGLRAHEILQELRDISSMAIEHFDEHVVNLLKRRYTARPIQCMISTASTSKALIPPPFNIFDFQTKQKANPRFVFGLTTPSETKNIEPALREVRSERRFNRCLDAEVNKKLIIDLKVKNKVLTDKVTKMQKMQARQTRQLRLSALLFSKMNTQLMEMKRRLNEVESKNTDIAANFNHITGIKPKSQNNVELLQQVLSAELPEHHAPIIQPRSSSIYKKRTAAEILGVNADILKKRTRSE